MILKKIDLLSDLNDKQKEAVEYFEKPLRIIAGAGSGKTKVLTRKVAYLVNTLGISPKNILAVTFTNKACNEMSSRIAKYCEDNKLKIKVFTFHSLCANILRKHIRLIGYPTDFLIIDEIDKVQILQEIYRRLQVSTHEISYKNMIQYISWAKNYGYDANQFADKLKDQVSDVIPRIYQEYLNELASKGSLDFDDLIINTNILFETHPEIAARYQKYYQYVLIDEFQDTSENQYNIIKSIVGKNTHLTIVGDPDQTIYNWRGADVNLILNFDKDYKDAKTIVLDTNYRSTKKILTAANKLIKHNSNRFNKDLITNNEEGEDIEFYHGFSVEAEARWVVQKINELKKQKNQLKNIAILYRSNYYSRPFEEALIQENINHKIFNGTKFFQRTEIKDAIAFLRVIADGQDIALNRIINIPNRGIGEVTLKKLKAFADKNSKTLFKTLVEDWKKLPLTKEMIIKNIFPFLQIIAKYQNALKSNSISIVLDKMLEEIGYYKHIEGNKNLRGSAIDNVKELISSIANWEAKNPESNVIDYLNMVSLLSVSDEYDNITNYVSLMTIHSAKGLEFDNIFLVGLTEGVFPSYKSLRKDEYLVSSAQTNKDEAIEEERRLAYVAVTRAKKKLFISDSRGKLIGTDQNKVPSRFIVEMGINLQDTILFNNHSLDLDDEDENEDQESGNNILVGDIISHIVFGEGEVLDVNSYDIVVKFIKDGAQKTLNKNHPSIKVISK
ncbi:AAA family ATPase [Mycoplasma sp. NEAQ87857]|uniref:ATP-dependent helicase n=1 Tax=Mycoplasma sp. NEAQ87857 TaxID=2683967 RepID=UPI001317AF09|nr:UvrD-helicase domain-containing protein [Mycoplasma sp. NEAQ87857]QGZ97682.1 AAA family ATPase [Mycoplasma sp. NEAQ87857]